MLELVLLNQGDANYKSVLAKLHDRYDYGIEGCIDHPEYLKSVMKEVYENKYEYVLDAISLETKKLVNIDALKANFFL